MHFLLFLTVLVASSPSWAQGIDDLMPVSGFLAVAAGDMELLDRSMNRSSLNCDPAGSPAPAAAPLIRELPIYDSAETGWRFSVQVNMGGPRGALGRHLQDAPSGQLTNELSEFISRDFGSYEQRMAAVGELCAGKSELERIQLGSILGGRLGGIYDYDRANNGPNSGSVVSPADQWQALRNGGQAGVCRDASLTVAHFLNACGFRAEQMSLESYRTAGSGHQVVTVRDSNGQAYTINWSELIVQDEDNRVAGAPSPNIVNTDIFVTSFDPITGEQREQRRTELGEVLQAVTGGRVSDPNYLPQLLRLEATNGVLSANVFATETQRGDFAKGAALYYNNGSSDGVFTVNAGVAYASNRRETDDLSQDLLYFQAEIGFRPVITLHDQGVNRWTLTPEARLSTEMYVARNRVGTESGTSGNIMGDATIGATLAVESGDWAAWFGGDANVGLTTQRWNSEKPGRDGTGVRPGAGAFLNSAHLYGGASVRVGETWVTGTGQYVYSRSQTEQHYSLSARDGEDRFRVATTYSVYQRGPSGAMGREDYVSFSAGRTWKFEKRSLSLDANVSLPVLGQARNTAVGLTLTLR